MEAKASVKFVMISPHKLRLVANEIRGFSYSEAVDILRFMSKKGAPLLLKLLRSARANLGQASDDVNNEALYIKKLYVDGGPTLKRWHARARGRATRILRRTSHATVVLSDEG